MQKKEGRNIQVCHDERKPDNRVSEVHDHFSRSYMSTYVTLFCTSFLPHSSIVTERQREKVYY